MELTIEQIIGLFNRFKGLNGYEQVIENNGVKTAIFSPYQFDGSTCWNIAKNLNVLRKHVTDYEDAKKLLATSFSIVEDIQKNDPVKLAEFTVEVYKLLATKVEVKGVLKLKISGLFLDKNPIQPGTLADLADYIEE